MIRLSIVIVIWIQIVRDSIPVCINGTVDHPKTGLEEIRDSISIVIRIVTVEDSVIVIVIVQ